MFYEFVSFSYSTERRKNKLKQYEVMSVYTLKQKEKTKQRKRNDFFQRTRLCSCYAEINKIKMSNP